MSLITTRLRKVKERIKAGDTQVILNVDFNKLLKNSIMDLRVQQGIFDKNALSPINLAVAYFLNITQFYRTAGKNFNPVLFQRIEVSKVHRFGRSFLLQ